MGFQGRTRLLLNQPTVDGAGDRVVFGVILNLFVGEHQQGSLAELVTGEHAVKLLLSDGKSLPVCAVHHQQDELRVGIVCVPSRPQRLLSAEVPHDEVYVIPHNLLHVAADGGGGVDHLVQQELVQNRRLPGVVQPNQADLVFCNYLQIYKSSGHWFEIPIDHKQLRNVTDIPTLNSYNTSTPRAILLSLKGNKLHWTPQTFVSEEAPQLGQHEPHVQSSLSHCGVGRLHSVGASLSCNC